MTVLERIMVSKIVSLVKKKVKFILKDISLDEITDMYRVNSKAIGVYIHVPFCKSICPFCPYYKVIYNKAVVEDWLKYLINEISIIGRLFSEFDSIDVEWVYFGGGTPSILSPQEFRAIIEALNAYFNIKGSIGIEANPLDLSMDKVSRLLDLGISKISVGVQSFKDEYLSMLRRPEAGKSNKILKLLQDIVREFNIHINIDFLFSIPGQEVNDFINDIRTAIHIGVNQVTIYPLILVEYLRLYKEIVRGHLPQQPPLSVELKMLKKGKELLEDHGYSMSTIWSWTRGDTDAYETVSNEMEGEYLGFGPGAFSLTGLNEHMNIPSIKRWCNSLMKKKMLKYINRLSKDVLLWRAFANNLYIGKINLNYLVTKYRESKGINKLLMIVKILKILKYIDDRDVLTWKGHKLTHILIKSFVKEVPTKVTLQAMMQKNEIDLAKL